MFNFVTKKYQPNLKAGKGKFYSDEKEAEGWAGRSVHWEVHTFEIRRVVDE